MTMTLLVKFSGNPLGRYYYGVTKFRQLSGKFEYRFDYVEKQPTMTGYIEVVKHAGFTPGDHADITVVERFK